MPNKALYDTTLIKKWLPHRTPFLFVDRIVAIQLNENILAEKDLLEEEPFFAGHFPDRPIMPGVLVSEALAQTSGLLLGLSSAKGNHALPPKKPGYFLASINMKYLMPAKPGETLVLEAKLVKGYGGLFLFEVTAHVGDAQIAKGTLTLAEERV